MKVKMRNLLTLLIPVIILSFVPCSLANYIVPSADGKSNDRNDVISSALQRGGIDASSDRIMGRKTDQCYNLRHYFMRENFELIDEIPDRPFKGLNSGQCTGYFGPNSGDSIGSCCSLFIEKLLTAKHVINFENGIQENFEGINLEFANTSKIVKGSVTESIINSGLNLNTVFNKTYGIIYAQNSDLFYDFFSLLARFINQHDTDQAGNTGIMTQQSNTQNDVFKILQKNKFSLSPELITDFFFVELYIRMFSLINAQYNLTAPKFNSCLRSTYGNIRPFASSHPNTGPDYLSDGGGGSMLQQTQNVANQQHFPNFKARSSNNISPPEPNDLARDISVQISRSLNAVKTLIYVLEGISRDFYSASTKSYPSIPIASSNERGPGLIFQLAKDFLATETIRNSIMNLWGCSLCIPHSDAYETPGLKYDNNGSSSLLRNNQITPSSNHPCPNYCQETVEGATRPLLKLSQPWIRLIETADALTKKLQTSLNVKNTIETLDVKISESIMNFQENSHKFSAQVFRICGQPPLKRYGNSFVDSLAKPHASTTTNQAHDWSSLRSYLILPKRDDAKFEAVMERAKNLLENANTYWQDTFLRSLKIKYCPLFLTNDQAGRVKDKSSNSRFDCWNGTRSASFDQMNKSPSKVTEIKMRKIIKKWERLMHSMNMGIRGTSIFIPDDEDENPPVEKSKVEEGSYGYSKTNLQTKRRQGLIEDAESFNQNNIDGSSGSGMVPSFTANKKMAKKTDHASRALLTSLPPSTLPDSPINIKVTTTITQSPKIINPDLEGSSDYDKNRQLNWNEFGSGAAPITIVVDKPSQLPPKNIKHRPKSHGPEISNTLFEDSSSIGRSKVLLISPKFKSKPTTTPPKVDSNRNLIVSNKTKEVQPTVRHHPKLLNKDIPKGIYSFGFTMFMLGVVLMP